MKQRLLFIATSDDYCSVREGAVYDPYLTNVTNLSREHIASQSHVNVKIFLGILHLNCTFVPKITSSFNLN